MNRVSILKQALASYSARMSDGSSLYYAKESNDQLVVTETVVGFQELNDLGDMHETIVHVIPSDQLHIVDTYVAEIEQKSKGDYSHGSFIFPNESKDYDETLEEFLSWIEQFEL